MYILIIDINCDGQPMKDLLDGFESMDDCKVAYNAYIDDQRKTSRSVLSRSYAYNVEDETQRVDFE